MWLVVFVSNKDKDEFVVDAGLQMVACGATTTKGCQIALRGGANAGESYCNGGYTYNIAQCPEVFVAQFLSCLDAWDIQLLLPEVKGR